MASRSGPHRGPFPQLPPLRRHSCFNRSEQALIDFSRLSPSAGRSATLFKGRGKRGDEYGLRATLDSSRAAVESIVQAQLTDAPDAPRRDALRTYQGAICSAFSYQFGNST